MVTVFNILFLTYMILFISFYYQHQVIKMNVDEIVYKVADNVSTRGEFTIDLYDYLNQELSRFGRFNIRIGYRKQVEKFKAYFDDDHEIFNAFNKDFNLASERDTAFDKISVISGRNKAKHGTVNNSKFEIGDRITIQVEGEEMTTFGKLVNTTFLGTQPDRFIDTRIFAMKSAPIANNARNLVIGYDVIYDIKNLAGDEIIEVITRGNINDIPSARIYYTNLSTPVPLSTIDGGFVFRNISLTETEYDIAPNDYENDNYIPATGRFTKEIYEVFAYGNTSQKYKYIVYTYAG